MMTQQLALVRRELWEHRSIWVTPGAIGLIVTLGLIASFVAASYFPDIVDISTLISSNAPESYRRAALIGVLLGNTTVFLIAMWFLTIFYCLDTLYTERKDKSILFWRSLPVTDVETVVSKLLTALVVIPLVTFAAVAVSQLINLILLTIYVTVQGGDAGHIIWSSLSLFDAWLATLLVLLAIPLWISPLLGWFLFVSSWTRRSPFLVAFLPLAVVPLLEYVVSGGRSHMLWDAITTHLTLDLDDDKIKALIEGGTSIVASLDFGAFLMNMQLWMGLIVCGLFTTAAIYVRRYSDDS